VQNEGDRSTVGNASIPKSRSKIVRERQPGVDPNAGRLSANLHQSEPVGFIAVRQPALPTSALPRPRALVGSALGNELIRVRK
jgi:hypothetical protein